MDWCFLVAMTPAVAGFCIVVYFYRLLSSDTKETSWARSPFFVRKKAAQEYELPGKDTN